MAKILELGTQQRVWLSSFIEMTDILVGSMKIRIFRRNCRIERKITEKREN